MKLSANLVVGGVAVVAIVGAAGAGGAVAATMINGSQIRIHTIPENRLTPAAVAALRGQRGPQGVPGILSASKLTVLQQDFNGGDSSVQCPAGQYAVTGGAEAGTGQSIQFSIPADSSGRGAGFAGNTHDLATGWRVFVTGTTGRVYVVCAALSH